MCLLLLEQEAERHANEIQRDRSAEQMEPVNELLDLLIADVQIRPEMLPPAITATREVEAHLNIVKDIPRVVAIAAEVLMKLKSADWVGGHI